MSNRSRASALILTTKHTKHTKNWDSSRCLPPPKKLSRTSREEKTGKLGTGRFVVFPPTAFGEFHFPALNLPVFQPALEQAWWRWREVSSWLCISFVSFVCFVVNTTPIPSCSGTVTRFRSTHSIDHAEFGGSDQRLRQSDQGRKGLITSRRVGVEISHKLANRRTFGSGGRTTVG